MPTYEYKCDACGKVFEKFQSITAAPIRKCPHCGKNKVRRLIGAGAGLIFKGSGFYITDYRDKSYADKAKAESGGGDKAPSDGSGESKTDNSKTEKSDTKLVADKPVPAKADSVPARPGKKSKPK